MKNPLDEHYFMIECEVCKEKNRLLGETDNSYGFETLVSERIGINSINSLISKASCDKSTENVISSIKDKESKKKQNEEAKKFKKNSEKQLKIVKKKNKKKIQKREKRMNETLKDFLYEKEIIPGALMAELMKKAEKICVYDNNLMIYNNTTGCFELCTKDEFSLRLNSILNKDVRLRVKSGEYAETFKQLIFSDELRRNEDFFENLAYVNCLNGVVNVLTGELMPHAPKYCFKNVINANYTPTADCPKYLEYLNHLFDGDEELILLIQVVQGYICSHYNNAKKAFLVFGQSHTGKSVFHNVIERIIGRNFVSHADLSDLCRQEYAASLAGKLLNIAPDLKNVPLKDVGFFKSLVSHDDIISTRALYSNPGNVRGETKMLFTSNHMIEFDKSVGEDDVKAVFNRLIYLPVQCDPIDENQENKHLSAELFEERDAIFTWGLQGLKRYIEAGERFPKAKASEQIKKENIAKYCPEKTFFDEYIVEAPGQYESVTAIKEAYVNFCKKYGSLHKGTITKYIEGRLMIEKPKKRIDKNGNQISTGSLIHVYPNIRLVKK